MRKIRVTVDFFYAIDDNLTDEQIADAWTAIENGEVHLMSSENETLGINITDYRTVAIHDLNNEFDPQPIWED